MPAPQQSSVPVYKETSNIPRPNTAYYLHDKRDSAGYQLANLLNVASNKFAERHNANKQQVEQQDEGLKVAHAQLGLENINRATSQGTFDLITGDFDLDSYDMKQGQLSAADYAGSIRDAYMAEEAFNITDPKEFNTWLQGKVGDQIAAAKAKGPSYYNGFVKELGGNVELLTKQYAGKTQEVIANKSADAFKNKLKLSAEADAATTRATEIGGWLKGFLGSESAGNWNAWFGNSGNREDLSQLTIGEIRKRQARPGNDAAGLIQIIPSTLDAMVQKYGYSKDQKFTPQVQTEMALYLMKEKGLDKWLRGEMSDGTFANRVASVWAGLKTSSGKGVYDGDGVNKGTQGHSVTVGQLGQLRYLMDRNPQLKQLMLQKEVKAGDTELVLGGSSNTNVSTLLENEAQTGVSNVKGRELYADMLVETIQSDPSAKLDVDNIEREMDSLKLNKEQRDRVRQAVETRQASDEVSSQTARQERINTGISATLSDNPEDLKALVQTDPDLYRAVVQRQATGDGQWVEDATEEYLTNLRDAPIDGNSSKPISAEAFRKYVGGELTRDGLQQAVEYEKQVKTYRSVIKTPAIRTYITSIKRTLPGSATGPFDQLMTATLNDLIDQNDGKRPPVAEIISAIDQMAQIVTQRQAAERQSIMDKYKL
jgi:hypothetical protein